MRRWMVAVGAGLGAAALAGCSSRVAYRDHGPEGGNQGNAWEVVLSGPLGASVADPRGAPEYNRLAARMNRQDDPVYPLDAWPRPIRPTLERPRRITIPTHPDSVQFYLNSRPDPWYDRYSDLY